MELLALSLAILDWLEAVLAQTPVEPAPGANQDEVPVWTQDPRDLCWAQSARPLGNKIKEAIGVGEASGATGLEGDPTLGIEPDPSHRCFYRFGGGVGAAYSGAWELARQEKHALAVTALDLKYAFGSAGDMQHRGGKRGERRRGHRPII